MIDEDRTMQLYGYTSDELSHGSHKPIVRVCDECGTYQVMCNVRGGKLEAHHIRPVRCHKNDLLIFDVNNGITLCANCHNSLGNMEATYIEQFDDIIGA